MRVRHSGKKLNILVVAILFLIASFLPYINTKKAYAAQITVRSLTLQAGTTDGGSKPSGVVKHNFAFTLPTAASVGSIKFEYCTTATDNPVGGGSCVMPTGLSTTSATLGSQTGATGFTINNSTNGAPYITRTAASISANTAVTYQLATVTNPSAANTTFFVRISSYTATNATGTPIDTGSVAASTANPIVLSGIMPESLIFCTGATVSTTLGNPDCSTATSGNVNFNQLFSPSDTATATSQMAASTNATSGYAITVNGATLTSGANTIAAMGTAAAGTRGTAQFGMNLMANTTTTSTPAIGTAVAPAYNVATPTIGQPATGYNTADTFKYASGDSVATDSGPTNAQIFTSSYIVNVPGSQPAGTYTTTLTYICTPTF